MVGELLGQDVYDREASCQFSGNCTAEAGALGAETRGFVLGLGNPRPSFASSVRIQLVHGRWVMLRKWG